MKQSINCIGRYYRYSFETYVGSADDINVRQRLRFLKSKSCQNTECEACTHLCEYVDEACANLLQYLPLDGIPYDVDHHGAIYQLTTYGYWTDPETGIVDDYTVGFVPVAPTD